MYTANVGTISFIVPSGSANLHAFFVAFRHSFNNHNKQIIDEILNWSVYGFRIPH